MKCLSDTRQTNMKRSVFMLWCPIPDVIQSTLPINLKIIDPLRSCCLYEYPPTSAKEYSPTSKPLSVVSSTSDEEL